MRRVTFLIVTLLLVTLIGCQGVGQNRDTAHNPPDLAIPADSVEDYLAAHLLEASLNGQIFCAYDVLATERSGDTTVLYLWTLCEEIYCDQQRLEQGSGVSLPVAVRGERQGSGVWSFEHSSPQDGLNYDQEIRTIFPRSTWSDVLPASAKEVTEFNRRVQALEDKVSIAAQASFEACQ